MLAGKVAGMQVQEAARKGRPLFVPPRYFFSREEV